MKAIVRPLKNPANYQPLLAIRNPREYDAAMAQLNALVDEIGDNASDPRYRFIDTLSLLIEAYDVVHHPVPDISGVELIRFLMEQHGLTQSNLPEIGSQGVVSEVLRGKRDLNVRQIAALAKRFGLSPSTFFSTPD